MDITKNATKDINYPADTQLIGVEGGECKDVLLTLRFYSQNPYFATALPAGTARAESPAGTQ